MNDQNDKDIYRELYNDHDEYVSIRSEKGKVYDKYIDDVRYWKLRFIEKLLTHGEQEYAINEVVEVGCATGVLLSNFLKDSNLNKTGVDISDLNISAAKTQLPHINFFCGAYEDYLESDEAKSKQCDVVIMSDILEHVEGDVELLRDAGNNSKYVIINLPIEKVPEYKDRVYGIDDIEGHLRSYSVDDAIKLCEDANMEIVNSYVEQYVKQPVFRKYLLNKLLEKFQDKTEALIKYQEELNHIDIHSDYYKLNYFALLRRK